MFYLWFLYSKQQRNITDMVKHLYFSYFKLKLGDQDKKWAPHIVCERCLTNLRGWANRRRKGMAFGIPMIWREPKDHVTDCCLCL